MNQEQGYLDVMKIELRMDRVCVLYSQDDPGAAGREYAWKDYLNSYADRKAVLERSALMEELSSRKMLRRCLDGEKVCRHQYRCRMNEEEASLAVQAYLCRDLKDGSRAYVLARRLGKSF